MDVRIFFCIAVSVGMSGAASPGPNLYAIENRPSPDRFNYFDAELLEVLTRNSNGNVLISPLAVKVALEMLMEGAVGQSADEIRRALRLNEEDGPVGKESQKWSSLQTGTATELLKIATKVFVSDRYRINPEYRNALMRKFGSDVAQVRFYQPREAVQMINTWVTDATSGLVTKLADEGSIDPQSKLMLANAVYFKGKWLRPFPEENTFVKCFKTANDDCFKVSMMMESGQFPYAYIPKLDAEAINLPYEGGRFSILLVLPKKKDGCLQLSRDMIHVGLEEIVSELRNEDVHVEIPKFAVESSNDLRAYLEQLQIHEVFSSFANLSRISADKREPIQVNKILHSAKLVMNEEGTEAAAAVGMLFVPLMGGSPIAFVADHPFLFFVRDRKTGSVLFSGKIERPEEESSKKLFTNIGNIQSFAPKEEPTPIPKQTSPARETVPGLGFSQLDVRNGRNQFPPQTPQTSYDEYNMRQMKIYRRPLKNVWSGTHQDRISFQNWERKF